jgi:hypothetical protein
MDTHLIDSVNIGFRCRICLEVGNVAVFCLKLGRQAEEENNIKQNISDSVNSIFQTAKRRREEIQLALDQMESWKGER